MNSDGKLDLKTEKFRLGYLGTHYLTTDGKVEFYISRANSYADVDITFIPSGYTKRTSVGNIKKGISNPFAVKGHPELTKPFIFTDPQLEFVGLKFKTNEECWLQITKYEGYGKVHYKFLDEFGYYGHTTLQNIKNGEVKNPYVRNAAGGYLGDSGIYSGIEFEWLRNTWYQMLNRASGKRHNYKEHIEAYDNVAIYPAWYNYTLFAHWYMNELATLNQSDNIIYQVDKDLMYPFYSRFSRGRKCYSPFTCVLIPKPINVVISTIYRKKSLEKLNNDIEFYLKNNCISIDTYSTIKRFYIKDPKYADYVTTKYIDMQNIVGF